MGGNGFMAVSATHAALRLAQGAGRLIRRGDDRGVVAFLDSRMMTARYAGFLQRSLPPFWPTTDRERVLAALQRLDQTAAPPVEVHEPALRGATGAVAGTSMAGATGGRTGEDAVEHPRPVAPDPPAADSSRTAVTGGHAWTADTDAELREGVGLGLSLDELADHLDAPAEAVAARLAGLGLEATGAQTLSLD
jgi:ATP-dependent DNA helicase DinG